MNLFLTKEALYRLSYVGVTCSNKKKNGMAGQGKAALDIKWSGRRGSNSRHSAWKAEALPTELLPPDSFEIDGIGKIAPLFRHEVNVLQEASQFN